MYESRRFVFLEFEKIIYYSRINRSHTITKLQNYMDLNLHKLNLYKFLIRSYLFGSHKI